MVPVISQNRWARWCKRKDLPVDSALFALETCCYGLGFCTHLGTILITNAKLIHHSYSWFDTYWAIFNLSSKRVSIPLANVRAIGRLKMNWSMRFVFGFPDAIFRVVTHDGDIHDFILQRRGDDFEQALLLLGLPVSDVTIVG